METARKFLTHFATYPGSRSALCYIRHRTIRGDLVGSTIEPEKVTCEACKRLMAMRKSATPPEAR